MAFRLAEVVAGDRLNLLAPSILKRRRSVSNSYKQNRTLLFDTDKIAMGP
jgi:hypothetical protein